MSAADRLLSRLHVADMAERTEAKLRDDLAKAQREAAGVAELRAQLSAQGKALGALQGLVTELHAKFDHAASAERPPDTEIPVYETQVVSRDGNGRALKYRTAPVSEKR